MKSDEEILERVLAGLGEAEVPEGMERRILRGLEGPLNRRAASHWRGIAASKPLVWGLGLAGLIAGAWIAVGYRSGHDSTNIVQGQSVAMPRMGGSSEARVLEGALRRPRVGLPRDVPKGPERREMLPRESKLDSVAVSEMRAVSFPAPPMPLTEQEELLLRIAHIGDPEELAMLEPEMRMAREAQEKLEVQRFFGAISIAEAPSVTEDEKE